MHTYLVSSLYLQVFVVERPGFLFGGKLIQVNLGEALQEWKEGGGGGWGGGGGVCLVPLENKPGILEAS